MEERELRFPARPLATQRRQGEEEAPAEGGGDDLFASDGEEELQRLARRKQAMMELRSRTTGRQAQITAVSSSGVDLREMRNALMAPTLSFDWQEKLEDLADKSNGLELEVEVPVDRPNSELRRNLLKDDLVKSRSKRWAEKLLPDEEKAMLTSESQAVAKEEAVPSGIPEVSVGIPEASVDVPEASMGVLDASDSEEEVVIKAQRRRRVLREEAQCLAPCVAEDACQADSVSSGQLAVPYERVAEADNTGRALEGSASSGARSHGKTTQSGAHDLMQAISIQTAISSTAVAPTEMSSTAVATAEMSSMAVAPTEMSRTAVAQPPQDTLMSPEAEARPVVVAPGAQGEGDLAEAKRPETLDDAYRARIATAPTTHLSALSPSSKQDCGITSAVACGLGDAADLVGASASASAKGSSATSGAVDAALSPERAAAERRPSAAERPRKKQALLADIFQRIAASHGQSQAQEAIGDEGGSQEAETAVQEQSGGTAASEMPTRRLARLRRGTPRLLTAELVAAAEELEAEAEGDEGQTLPKGVSDEEAVNGVEEEEREEEKEDEEWEEDEGAVEASDASDCDWLANEEESAGMGLDRSQRKQLRLERLEKRCEETRRHERRLRFEIEDAGELRDAGARAALLGSTTMSQEEQRRWRSIIGDGSHGSTVAAIGSTRSATTGATAAMTSLGGAGATGRPAAALASTAPTKVMAAGARRLLGTRQDDDNPLLYSFGGGVAKAGKVSFLSAGGVRAAG